MKYPAKKLCTICGDLKDLTKFTAYGTYCIPCKAFMDRRLKSGRKNTKILSESEMKKELKNYKAPAQAGVNALIEYEKSIDRALGIK